jgi:hypothetical protein
MQVLKYSHKIRYTQMCKWRVIMAAPVGHLYLALQILSGPLAHVDRQPFIIGTLFPDIRYSAHLSRHTTHKEHVTWPDILQEHDPFKKGMLFHSFVDEQRSIYLARNVHQKMLPPYPYIYHCIKGAEDLVLIKKIRDKKFIDYLDSVLPQEKTFVKDEAIIREWHSRLKNYFTLGITPSTMRPFVHDSIPYTYGIQHILEIGAAHGFVAESYVLLLHQELMHKIMSFYEHFDALLPQPAAVLNR